MAGEGVAMGYAHVTAGLIEQGLLSPLGNWEYTTDQRYHLVWSNRSELSANAVIVRDWILDAVRHTSLKAPARS